MIDNKYFTSDNRVLIVNQNGCCSINWLEFNETPFLGIRAVIECQLFGNYWQICRTLVTPESGRSKGIGSYVLNLLIKEINKEKNTKIFVFPGGYSDDKDKQFNFYKKNGFTTPSIECFIECFEDVIEDERLHALVICNKIYAMLIYDY